MKSFDLNLLTALDALLDTGSVTAAAQRMHLSTPAMSHTLARIRAAVGDPLLVRAGRKLVPTPRALELMEPVRKLLSDAQALLEPLTAQDMSRVKRQFVIRAPDGMSVVYGAALSVAMQEVMPMASLKFLPESHSDASALREGRIDMDIGSFSGKDPETEWMEMLNQPLIGAVKAGHPLLDGKLTAKRFAAERHVALMLRQQEASPVDEALAHAGLSRFIALTVPNAYGALVTVSRAPLVTCVPARIAEAMRPSLGLTLFPLPFKLEREPVVLAWHPRHSADPAHTWLRGCFRRVLDDPHWQLPQLGPVATDFVATPMGGGWQKRTFQNRAANSAASSVRSPSKKSKPPTRP